MDSVPRQRAKRIDGPEPQRFWSKVDFTDSCWLWTAFCKENGYGQFRLTDHPRTVVAHRWAYTFCVGPIPAGLQLDHLCRVRACVNPAHLEAVTQRVNLLRGVSPPARNARKTHCPKGHPYTGNNIVINNAAGHRACRVCKHVAARASYRDKAAARRIEVAA